MKKYTTLEQLLEGQDLNAAKAAEKILLDQETDPITQTIVEAWRVAGGDKGELDFDEYDTFLKYAIKHLERARRRGKEISDVYWLQNISEKCNMTLKHESWPEFPPSSPSHIK